MMIFARRAALALFLTAPLILAGCGEQTAAPKPIPITDAAVSGDGTGRYTIAWIAPNVDTVTVYAGTDPSNVGREREVGSGGANGHLAVELPADTRWYFEFVPNDGGALVIAQRGLGLATVPNLRDAGGYRTTDGRWVKVGRVYRSDQLDKVSDADFAAMKDLGLKLICDFRTETERAAGADRVPEGTEHMIADVSGNSGGGLGAVLGDPSRMGEVLSQISAEEIMMMANRAFVSSDSARAAYKSTFERLADSGSLPTLFHCTAGKDRTGWSAAVLLTILGVPRDIVMHDYMLSNTFLAQKNRALLENFPPELAQQMIPLVGVRESYLNAAFEEVENTYGDFETYVRDGIGLSDDTVAALKANFLTPETAPPKTVTTMGY